MWDVKNVPVQPIRPQKRDLIVFPQKVGLIGFEFP